MTDTKDKAMTGQAANTDRELYREPDKGNGSFYSDSIHVTEGGGIGINVGGHVIVKSLQAWHALAMTPTHPHSSAVEQGTLSEEDRNTINWLREYAKNPKIPFTAEFKILLAIIDRLTASPPAPQAGEIEVTAIEEAIAAFYPGQTVHEAQRASISKRMSAAIRAFSTASRLAASPAPQAEGEIERLLLSQGAVLLDEQSCRNCEDDEAMAVIVIPIDLRDKILAALRSAQATARTYADGIEDAAKHHDKSAREWRDEGNLEIAEWHDECAAVIRALATKPAAR